MFPILRPLLHTAALACALPALAADPQPASGGWAQPTRRRSAMRC